jgi:hypothetical protein
VAPDSAGNAFAPEAYWDDSIGAYVVFWAQAMWQDTVNRTNPGNQQMWYTTTRDFRTFAPPAVWQNPFPQSRIDTTVIKVGDWYYRFTKNETNSATSDVFSEKNTNLRDADISHWTPVAPSIGKNTWVASQGYEGPLVFRANPGDTACPQQFYFWADRYTNGGGYQLSCSPDIDAVKWEAKTPRFTNTGTVRHGTVTPLALREWNRIQGIANPDVSTTTDLVLPADAIKEGDVLKAVVRAADGYQTGGRVRFSIAGWQETAYLENGVASVTLPGTLRGGVETVRAEYLGFDFLTASEESESTTILQTQTPVDVTVGGNVPAILALTLGAPASFGAFTPGVAKDYTASTTATVTSTAGDATLSASPATLTNGAFSLAQPVVITPAKTTWAGPTTNDTFPIAFKQTIGANEPLRTGSYSASVTFTLATTTP